MLNPTLNRRTASKGHVTLLILAALALTLPLAAMQPQGAPAPSRETQPANPAAAIDVIRLPGGFTTDSLTLKAENLTIDLTTGSLVARGQVSMRQAKPITHEVTTLAASTISISPAASPQQATGTISGTVSDATGALVPGVRINVTNRNTGNITAIVTNSSGAFAVPGLPPGNFDMTATLPGFQTSKASAISVQAGLNVQVKVTLRVATSVVINVVTEAPSGSCLALLGTTKADGTIYTRADCLELNAAVRNAPPRIPRVPEPDDIVILGTSPIAAPSPQVAAGGRQIQRIGGDLEAGNLLFHPSPAYPPEARRIGIEGSVVLSASIGEDGTVRSVQVLDSSSPLLNQPQVVEAIQSWRFKPTFLNGQPIETTTTVTVNFTIGR